MKDLKEVPAHELIAALFDVVTEEAKRNRAFARRLLAVYPEQIVARIASDKERRSAFDPAAFHAVNILRNHGEAMLRGRLSSLNTKAQLRKVATRSGLRLTGRGARASATKAEIIDAIVEAARHYIAQRRAAAK